MKKYCLFIFAFITLGFCLSYSALPENDNEPKTIYSRMISGAKGCGASFASLALLAVTSRTIKNNFYQYSKKNTNGISKAACIFQPILMSGASAYLLYKAMPFAYNLFKQALTD